MVRIAKHFAMSHLNLSLNCLLSFPTNFSCPKKLENILKRKREINKIQVGPMQKHVYYITTIGHDEKRVTCWVVETFPLLTSIQFGSHGSEGLSCFQFLEGSKMVTYD